MVTILSFGLIDEEELQHLAESILSNGLINPITVRVWKDKFMIVAGERRWRACKLAGLKKIEAFVKTYKDDVDWQIESLIENWQRENLSSVEKEKYLWKIWNVGKFKTHKELGKALGVSEGNIQGILRAREIRKNLPKQASANISTRTILDVKGLEKKEQTELLTKISKGKISQTDSNTIREYARVIKQSTPEVKKALLSDEINVEQAERITKLKTPEQRTKAIQEHKNIGLIDRNIERNVENQETANDN